MGDSDSINNNLKETKIRQVAATEQNRGKGQNQTEKRIRDNREEKKTAEQK